MLNNCGHALRQRDGNDFNHGCNWEAAPSGYRACVRAWSKRGPCNFGVVGTHAALVTEGEPRSFGAPFAMQFRKLESKM